MAAEQHHLFEVVELLENIFLSMAPVDVLRAQRVCKIFKGVIAGSMKIQVALFRKPESDARVI